jgi:hypothetical protein
VAAAVALAGGGVHCAQPRGGKLQLASRARGSLAQSGPRFCIRGRLGGWATSPPRPGQGHWPPATGHPLWRSRAHSCATQDSPGQDQTVSVRPSDRPGPSSQAHARANERRETTETKSVGPGRGARHLFAGWPARLATFNWLRIWPREPGAHRSLISPSAGRCCSTTRVSASSASSGSAGPAG